MMKSAMRALGLCALGLAVPQSAQADLLTNWNVVTTGDLYAGNGVQGAVRVGGSLYVQNNFTAASSKGSPTSAYSSLIVGKNVSTSYNNRETVKVAQGNATIGGTINGASNNNAGIVSANNGTVKMDSSISGIGATDLDELKSDSAAFSAMTGSESVYLPTKQVDTAKLTVTSVDSLGNAVFNIDGATLFQNSLVRGVSLDLNGFKFGTGQSVVINVTGDALKFQSGYNFSGDFQSAASNIIWNFSTATSINLNSNNLYGALLAPLALLQNSNGVTGSIFVSSLSSVSNVSLPYYQGYDPSAIRPGATPEPSSIVLAGIALASTLIVHARRRRND
ncbi:collagen-binding domain-containing protein [Paludisphaera rhizosphaerae]|uniref:collagen-binding domain-containing protein n=1 Tax=Paludisphaera rhizosphaerae TaxID=2711216 RepID=UPI0013EB1564|nr:collagen-binding domain-containing protein [Paludisphaera rhizosphaerae]